MRFVQRLAASILLFLSALSPQSLRAQIDELIIQGETGNLYLLHTVVPKENWYSVGRLFNQSPKLIASFNNLKMDNGLEIGQTLQIPLTSLNFSQTTQKTAGETLVPVYHIVQEKEWMYRISANHNKVPIKSLEKWNQVTGDQVKPGMHLIVGFLRVKTALSSLARQGSAPPVPPAAQPATAAISSQPVKSSPPLKDTARVVSKQGQATDVRQDVHPEIHQETVADPGQLAKNFNGGYFKADFADAGKTMEGLAGVFKSISGWQDGKYYALMNNLPVGTIVQVFSPATNKAIYAKVLGQLPDMKESAGLTIRISNAAAADLGAVAARFNVEIKY